MTTICPEMIPQNYLEIFSSMDAFSVRFAALPPEGGQISLLDLTQLRPLMEQEAGLKFLTSLLSPDEARLFAGFTYPKRRLEWLGGRLTAKHCLNRLPTLQKTAPFFYRDYALLPDGHGRPTLAPPPDLKKIPALSISHSRNYAAALATPDGACGIDIQQKSAQLTRVQERFASEKELALPDQPASLLTRLGLIWTAKETVKKCLLSDQSTFFGTINLTKITYEPKSAIWTADCQVLDGTGLSAVVRIVEFEEYLLACATRKRDA